MDVNWARSLFTVSVFIGFLLVLLIVFSKRNKANYEEASRSIIDDEDTLHEDAARPNRDNGAKE
ncbi:cbb3-type cytochrome c oxidase subunit 3 [Neisseria leonii]|uniref:Cbb3-type cytochrome c oxidase subunit 3 n=1 Tax=Neisseria leonii TaxID=2995413 RepID=A0A9X4DZQ9_9NEIS|nr:MULTISPECIES: cbb3-type cytochrome c oxidase subunit 3 [unclassified Neisseria]MDD9325573.1 cbb3-type cytochrome c oxidase subunit 3 [Neisseria sp. 3986]MDD9326838.1 cbb3-type cytochrome c oxidase subunit 3 [Neisseria sp. 51.81]